MKINYINNNIGEKNNEKSKERARKRKGREMKSYKICKLAARKVLSDNYCVLSIKTTGNSSNDEIIEIGVIDKNDDIVVDMKFKPETMLEVKPIMKLFQVEYPEIVKKLSEYDHIVLFNENLTKKMFTATAEKYEISTRYVDKMFKNVFDMQALYDLYINTMNSRLTVICQIEGIDTANINDALAISGLLDSLLKTVGSEYTHPNVAGYAAESAKSTSKKQTIKTEKKPKEKKQFKSRKDKYLDSFKSGKTITEIAAENEVKETTVASYVIDEYLAGNIDSIDTLIGDGYYDKIIEMYESEDWDGTWDSIKSCMPDDCTEINIRASVAKKKKSDGYVPDDKEISAAEVYAKLYNLGKSLTEIAREKGVQIHTAAANVIQAYEDGFVENIDNVIQGEYIQKVLEVIKASDWDGKLKSVKEKLDEKCSYNTIKAVIAKNKKGCYNEEESSADVPDSSNNIPQEPSNIE